MHTLHLTEFIGYSNEDIYAYLLSRNENSFRIILKRNFMLPLHDIEEVATEYFNAIQLASALLQLTQNFSYNVPSEHSDLPFIFEFSLEYTDYLAVILFCFIRDFVQKEDATAVREKYQLARASFLEHYMNDEVSPACHGLIYKMDMLILRL